MKSIKSQLEVMAGTVPSTAPQSHLARFIAGELKGGETKHDYAMSVVHTAIEQALKGNQRDIPEAVKLCTGKAIKAKAYQAGFHAIADSVKPLTYEGKLADAVNAPVRAQIADHGRAMACEFELAYLAVLQNAKVEAAFNRAAKTKSAAKSAATGEGEETAPVIGVDAVVVDIATSVEAVAQAIKAGLLDPVELALIRNALEFVPVAAPALLAA